MVEKGFRAARCKTVVKLVISRIALVRNKRGAQIRHLHKDVALLLQRGEEPTARKRVDMLIKDQNILDAYAVLEKFCEFVLTQLDVIKAERSVPFDTKEAISSLIFAAPRCADLPELQELRSIFEEHYGKQFVIEAVESKSGSGVNKMIFEKLSNRTVNEDFKLALMMSVADENGVDWSPKRLENFLPSDAEIRIPKVVNREHSTGHVHKTYSTIQDKISNEYKPVVAGFVTETPSAPCHLAEDQEVSSTSKESATWSSSLEEQRQFIPFVSRAPPQLFSAASVSLEAKTYDSEKDANNDKRHETSRSRHIKEELLSEKASNWDALVTEKRMFSKAGDSSPQVSSDTSKHGYELHCAGELSSARARQDLVGPHDKTILKPNTDLHWSLTEESARRSLEHERNLAGSNKQEYVTVETPPDYKREENQVFLQNQTPKFSRIIPHSSAISSSEDEKGTRFIQRPSTSGDSRAKASSSLTEDCENSSDIEPNVRSGGKIKSQSSSHATETIIGDGNYYVDAQLKYHEGRVWQDVSRQPAQVLASRNDGWIKDELDLNKNDSDYLAFDSSMKGEVHCPGRSVRQHIHIRAEEGASERIKSSITSGRSDEYSSDFSPSELVLPEVAVYLKGDDGYHDTKHNKNSVGKQNPKVNIKQNAHFAKISTSDHDYAIQTPVFAQISTQDNAQGESRIEFTNADQKNNPVVSKQKHYGENDIQPTVRGSSSNARQDVHGNLKWRASSPKEEDSSLQKNMLQPSNPLDESCEADKVKDTDSDTKDRRFPLLMSESARASRLEAASPSAVKSKRTIGVSVRSKVPAKTAAEPIHKMNDLGDKISLNQKGEAVGGHFSENRYQEASFSEYSADANRMNGSSSEPMSSSCLPMARPIVHEVIGHSLFPEVNNVQKTNIRSMDAHSKAILSEHNSRQPTDSSYHHHLGAISAEVDSIENQEDEAMKGPASSTRAQEDEKEVEPVSLKSSASHLPVSQAGSKARNDMSSTRLGLLGSHHQITESQDPDAMTDDDLTIRFQALKARLFQ